MKKHSHNAPAARRPQLDGSMDPTISFMRLPDGTKVPWAVATRSSPTAPNSASSNIALSSRPHRAELLQEKARSGGPLSCAAKGGRSSAGDLTHRSCGVALYVPLNLYGHDEGQEETRR